jgi:hypothetical protein
LLPEPTLAYNGIVQSAVQSGCGIVAAGALQLNPYPLSGVPGGAQTVLPATPSSEI